MNQELKIEAGDNQQMVIHHLQLTDILLVVIPIVIAIILGIEAGPGIGGMMGFPFLGLIVNILLGGFYGGLALILSFQISSNRTFRLVLAGILLTFAFVFLFESAVEFFLSKLSTVFNA